MPAVEFALVVLFQPLRDQKPLRIDIAAVPYFCPGLCQQVKKQQGAEPGLSVHTHQTTFPIPFSTKDRINGRVFHNVHPVSHTGGRLPSRNHR